MEVVFKEGILYLQRNMFGKKTWKKTWAMLYPPSIFGIGRLELYDLDCDNADTASSPSSQLTRSPSERKLVRLCDCLNVTPASEDTCPPPPSSLYNDSDFRAFCVNTTQRIYTLASEDHHDWLTALSQLAFQTEPVGWMDPREKRRADRGGMKMEENGIYTTWKTAQYQVNVQTNEASRRCQLTGSYLLSPEQDGILLQDLQNRQTLYCWPYYLLRRFGQVKGGFCIEAGRRCTSGEGLFTFMSEHAPQIYRTIKDAIAQHSEMDHEDHKTLTQHLIQSSPSPLSSPQLSRKTSSSSSPHTSFGLPRPPYSSSPPHPHTSSSSSRLPKKHKGQTHSLTDFPDRSATPPLPMRNNVLPSTPMKAPVTDSDLWQKRIPESDGYLYATVKDQIVPVPQRTPAPLRMQHSLPLHEEEEEEDSEERCHSLDAINLDKLGLGGAGQGVEEACTYYNVRKGLIRRAEEKRERVGESSDWVYAEVNKPPLTQPPPPAQTQFLGQLRGGEETGSLGSGGSVTTFKQKLSDILCKDLAKFQPPVYPRGPPSPKASDSTNAYHY